MDAATTNQVLKNLNPRTVLSKMRIRRRNNPDAKSATSTATASTTSAATATAAISSSTTTKRVHFNCIIATTAKTVHYTDPVNDPCRTVEEEKQERWYNKKELYAMFLKDLENYLRDQVDASAAKAGTNNEPTSDGRGFESLMPHSLKRNEEADRYVKAVVNKSYAIRKASSSSSHKKRSRARAACADVWAEELADFIRTSEHTKMSCEVALAQGALDAVQAQLIYQEASTTSPPPTSGLDKQSLTSSSSSSSSQVSLVQCEDFDDITPISFTAKSA